MTDTTTSERPQSLNVFLDPEKYDSLRRQWSDQYIWSPAPVPGDIPLHRTAFISDLDEKEAAEEEAERQKREEEARRKREEEAAQQQREEEEEEEARAAAAAAAADDEAAATPTGDDEGSGQDGDGDDQGQPALVEADKDGRGAGHRKSDSAVSVASRSSRSSQGQTMFARSARGHDDGGETLASPSRRPAYASAPRPLPFGRGEAADIKGPRTTARKPFRRPAPISTNPNPKRLRSFHLPALRGDGGRDANNSSNKNNNNNKNNTDTNKDTQVTSLPIIASPTSDETPYTHQPIMASPSGVVASPTQDSPSASPEEETDADANYTHGPGLAPSLFPPAPESEAGFSMYATAPGTPAVEHEGHDLRAQTPRGPRADPFADPDMVANPNPSPPPPPPAASQNVVPEPVNAAAGMPPAAPTPLAPVAPAPGIAAASPAPLAPVPDAAAPMTTAANTGRGRKRTTSKSPFPNRASRAARQGKASSLPSDLPSMNNSENTTSRLGPPASGPVLQRAHSAPMPPAAHKRSLTLQLDLNLDVEVELHAKIGGDLTLTLF